MGDRCDTAAHRHFHKAELSREGKCHLLRKALAPMSPALQPGLGYVNKRDLYQGTTQPMPSGMGERGETVPSRPQKTSAFSRGKTTGAKA